MSLNKCISLRIYCVYILFSFFLFPPDSFEFRKMRNIAGEKWVFFIGIATDFLIRVLMLASGWAQQTSDMFIQTRRRASLTDGREKNLDLTLICYKQKCYIPLAKTPFIFRRINPYEAVFELLRGELVVFICLDFLSFNCMHIYSTIFHESFIEYFTSYYNTFFYNATLRCKLFNKNVRKQNIFK